MTMLLPLLLMGFVHAPAHADGPDLGEIMLGIQQHHAKLYFAGKAANWELADYELDELRECFDDATKSHHEFKTMKTPLAELVPAMTKNELEQVDRAIKGGKQAEFVKRFQGLTNACNRCHQAAEHPFIVIQVPSQNPYSNQKFAK